MQRRCFVHAAALLMLLGSASPAAARFKLSPPEPGRFVCDFGQLLKAQQKRELNQIAERLLAEQAVALVVVTLPSLQEVGAAGYSIDRFAHQLMRSWQDRLSMLYDQRATWRKSVLLVVSRGDRKARIEMGRDWRTRKDTKCYLIMDRLMVPAFRKGQYALGIKEGVKGVDRMLRNQPILTDAAMDSIRRNEPLKKHLAIAGFLLLLVLTVVSLMRSGGNSWAYLVLSGVFGIIGTLLYGYARGWLRGTWLLRRRRRRGGYGGFSIGGTSGAHGGFSGGGFSGGGGATGSW